VVLPVNGFVFYELYDGRIVARIFLHKIGDDLAERFLEKAGGAKKEGFTEIVIRHAPKRDFPPFLQQREQVIKLSMHALNNGVHG